MSWAVVLVRHCLGGGHRLHLGQVIHLRSTQRRGNTQLTFADQMKRIRRESEIEHEFSIFWVPRRTLVSDQLLEEAGVLGEASVSEWPLFFVPLADDVLSLELDDAVSDLYLVRLCISYPNGN